MCYRYYSDTMVRTKSASSSRSYAPHHWRVAAVAAAASDPGVPDRNPSAGSTAGSAAVASIHPRAKPDR